MSASPASPASPAASPAGVPPARSGAPAALAAASGLVSALVAIGIGELLAGFVAGFASPVSAVGSALIDLAPPGSKEVVVSLFGTNDKVALELLVAGVVLAIGIGAGLLARRSFAAAAGVVVALGVVAGWAALRQAGSSPMLALLSATVETVAAVWTLAELLAAAHDRSGGLAAIPAGRPAGATSGADAPDGARRGFLLRAGVLGVLAVAGGGLGRRILASRAGEAAKAAVAIPRATDPAPSIAADAGLAVDGITPLIMPNDRFYRIDTALITPSIDVGTWTLRVFGMVDKEVTLTFDQLVQLPLIERYVTIACVSNEVGGNLVGNAKWTGVRLTDVLTMAGVKPGATQIVPRSVDDWTAGFPTAWINDPAHPRDAMIAVKMNDTPLPAEHGFPARLIVPGLYGYVSATKWLKELELTTLEAFDAYWVPRGWSKEAPILTQSRIDTPRSLQRLPAGTVVVAGVAWAPDRGITAVEVSVDGGAWQPATIGEKLSNATWVQWKLNWQATPGNHVLEVRATDGTGDVQTTDVTRPDPDGARGHHKVQLSIG
jgi:DMSO/TMAO reductase YedYZ molybdopterin-dependent catalytic subunit